jgi:hypothetical protein
MVRLQTRIPTLSNSPRIRSAPKTAVVPGHLLNQGHGLCGEHWFRRCCSGLVFPVELESLAMPAQQRLWLNNEEGLLPGSCHSGQKHEEHAVHPGTGRSFHLSTQDDQLLAEEGVFCHKLRLAPGKVGQHSLQERSGVGFGPGDEAVVEHLKAMTCQPLEKGENPMHGRRSPLVKISQ